MNLSLTKLPWYGQLAVFALIGVAAGVVFWQQYAAPTQEQIDQQRQQLATLRTQADSALRDARRLPEIRREVAAFEGQLAQLRLRLPEEKDVSALLRRIQGMATEANLTIRGFTPQTVTTRQTYQEWPIGLQVEGTYHNLGAFLERVSKFERIINVTGLRIAAKDAPTAAGTITAECTAMTFVMSEPRPAAAAGAAPAPAAGE